MRYTLLSATCIRLTSFYHEGVLFNRITVRNITFQAGFCPGIDNYSYMHKNSNNSQSYEIYTLCAEALRCIAKPQHVFRCGFAMDL